MDLIFWLISAYVAVGAFSSGFVTCVGLENNAPTKYLILYGLLFIFIWPISIGWFLFDDLRFKYSSRARGFKGITREILRDLIGYIFGTTQKGIKKGVRFFVIKPYTKIKNFFKFPYKVDREIELEKNKDNDDRLKRLGIKI